MASSPDSSLPDQYEGWGGIKAAYRFVNNPKVTPERIQSTHRQQVRVLCASQPMVLAVEDGSELDYSGHRSVSGLGFVGDSNGRIRLQHSTLAVTTDGHWLGDSASDRVAADPHSQGRDPSSTAGESQRVRLVGRFHSCHRDDRSDDAAIHVMDRGGDCYETM